MFLSKVSVSPGTPSAASVPAITLIASVRGSAGRGLFCLSDTLRGSRKSGEGAVKGRVPSRLGTFSPSRVPGPLWPKRARALRFPDRPTLEQLIHKHHSTQQYPSVKNRKSIVDTFFTPRTACATRSAALAPGVRHHYCCPQSGSRTLLAALMRLLALGCVR